MRFVLDTSSLINLRELEWLDLLRNQEDNFSCPQKVEQELKRRKRKNNEIFKLSEEGVLSILSVSHPIVFSALSNTDSDAISLALESNSTVVSEDGLLRENAIRYGVPAIDISGILLLFYQEGRIDKSDCLFRLKVLFENQILSKSRYYQLLISIRS